MGSDNIPDGGFGKTSRIPTARRVRCASLFSSAIFRLDCVAGNYCAPDCPVILPRLFVAGNCCALDCDVLKFVNFCLDCVSLEIKGRMRRIGDQFKKPACFRLPKWHSS
eukprot:GEMP01093854.1.p1 GENE.GEMP01093854.1~~GEMP01093854.1.p1  ORF type:complete len:109 (-),score=12.83 GEMP01093854.1:326-652(-)